MYLLYKDSKENINNILDEVLRKDELLFIFYLV